MIFPAAYDSVNGFLIPLLCSHHGSEGKTCLPLTRVSEKALTLLKRPEAHLHFQYKALVLTRGSGFRIAVLLSLWLLLSFQCYDIILTIPGQVQGQWDCWVCKEC